MGCDTIGRIKGFVSHQNLSNFIKEKYDKNVVDHVVRYVMKPISECDWKHKINEHSEDEINWYNDHGFIYFKYDGEKTALFYDYNNINHYENEKYYSAYGLADMVESETTYINLGIIDSESGKENVKILKEIISHFGGGWLDNNDCDDELPYWVDGE